ncbi:MAG: GNAT family N-acetyltransferase [Candidatus Limnocylindrales bacterium]
MPIEVRPGQEAEFSAYYAAVDTAFGGEDTTAAEIAAFHERVGDRFYVAADGQAIVGGAADLPFTLTVPGREIAAAGVTGVGILPTHRRQGLLGRLMALELDAIRSRGEALAVLWASEGSIYQRFGYGLATLNGSIELPRARSAFRPPAERQGRLRLIERAEADRVLPAVFERVRVTTPGAWARTAAWWKEILDDPQKRRRGGGPKFVVLHERDGAPDGYAIYRIQEDWDGSGPHDTLRVLELIADGPVATRELWRYLCDVDLVGTIAARLGPADHPLLHLLADPRALGLRIADGLWLRLVDLAAALEGRAYARAGRVVFEVRDAFRPDQAGRYLLEAGEGAARVTRTRARADLALDTSDLAAAYLGGTRFRSLAMVGRVLEQAPGAIERADSLFHSAIPPWSPWLF